MIIAAFIIIGCIIAVATAIALKHDEKEITPQPTMIELDQETSQLTEVQE